MIYPNWVVATLTATALVAERGANRPLEPLVQSVLQDLREWTLVPVYACERSLASVDIVTNRRTGERAVIWDARCFEYLDSALTVATADADLNPSENLQWLYLARVADKCASRLLKRSPEYAFAAKEAQRQIMGTNQISSTRLRDPLRFNNLRTIARVWMLLHEIGHVLYETKPELVTNIDDKLRTILFGLDQRAKDMLNPNFNLASIARDAMTKRGMLQSITTRLKSIRKILDGTLAIPREEIWCDIFASEQLVLRMFARRIDPSDAYLALMIIYYSTHTDSIADSFYDRSLTDQAYSRGMRSEALEARADLRAEMLIASLVEVFMRPLQLNLEQCEERWVNQHYPTLARFVDSEALTHKYLSPDFRPKVLHATDDVYRKLTQLEKTRQEEYITRLLRWNIPLL